MTTSTFSHLASVSCSLKRPFFTLPFCCKYFEVLKEVRSLSWQHWWCWWLWCWWVLLMIFMLMVFIIFTMMMMVSVELLMQRRTSRAKVGGFTLFCCNAGGLLPNNTLHTAHCTLNTLPIHCTLTYSNCTLHIKHCPKTLRSALHTEYQPMHWTLDTARYASI